MNMAGQNVPEKNSTQPKSHKKVVAAKKKQHRTLADTCFVLMPFKEPFDIYYSAIIEPAILAAHLEPLRGDSLFRPSPIMADVWQMIQDAKVLVAELTERNANVFYELGLAHAIGKPVILISETIVDVPFDLQPLRVLLYNKSDPAWGAVLKANLVSSLEETLEDLVRAVPSMFRKIVKSQAPEESALEKRVYELERRVSAISPPSPRVDWLQVSRDLDKSQQLSLTYPRFHSRDDVVAWTISQMSKQPLSVIQRKLQELLGHTEAEIVFDLALKGRQSKIDFTPTATQRRARKR